MGYNFVIHILINKAGAQHCKSWQHHAWLLVRGPLLHNCEAYLRR
jgi:hypothetical protein